MPVWKHKTTYIHIHIYMYVYVPVSMVYRYIDIDTCAYSYVYMYCICMNTETPEAARILPGHEHRRLDDPEKAAALEDRPMNQARGTGPVMGASIPGFISIYVYL